MPGVEPRSGPPLGNGVRNSGFVVFAPVLAGWLSLARRPAIVSALALRLALIAAPAAAAAADELALDQWLSFSDVILLAVFGGAMSFAILAASWLIRERSRMSAESAELRRRLSDLRATQERTEALVNVADQRIVVWHGADSAPQVIGRLSKKSGAPEERSEFLAFGRWLVPDSAISFEGALARLRQRAEAFDLPLLARGGGVVEAQGRTSGGYAFVRFVELAGDRLALSRLEAEHVRLNSLFDVMRALFEKLPTPAWLRDGLGALLWTNGAYAAAVDRPDAETVVRDGVELLDSPQRRMVVQAETGNGYFRGTVPAVVGGDRKVLEVTEVHSGAAYAGIAVDRSEIELANAALRDTVAGHRQTLDQLQAPIAMFDADQRLQFHNLAFARLFGLDEKFLESRPTNAELLDTLRVARKLPERPDWRKWRDAQLKIYRQVEPREEVWHLADGQTLRVFANPHSRGGATWVFQDVTEQLELESNYASLQRVQGETLDHLREAVAVFGPDGRLRLFNPAFAGLWRLGTDLAAGLHVTALAKPFRNLLARPQDWDLIADAVTGFDENRDTVTGRLDLSSGAIVDFALVPLPAAQSLLTFTDVTASVAFERTLRERNEALEQSDLLKTRFIRNVSYELRAPLTSIAGFAELMAMQEIGRLNPKQEEYVEHIGEAAGVLKSLIDDILDLASIDAGAVELEIVAAPLVPVIERCVANLAPRLAARQLKTEIELHSDARVAMADAERLRQMLHNVLSSAAAMSPDGGTISIRSRRSAGDIEIEVTDEGPPISSGDRERVFGRFERRSGDRQRRGSGLGLSIAKSLVELHGGTIRIGEEEKAGASIILRLPGRSQTQAA